jgi:poly [ADP-ribose] polymerase
MAVAEKKTFICVNFKNGKNNNKFWRYTLNDDDSTFVEWGRVVDDGTGNLVVQGSQHATKSKTMAKMRSKTNPNNKSDKQYTEVKVADGVSSVSSSTVASSALKDIIKKDIVIKDPIVKDLFDFLRKENVHDIVQASGGSISYDASSATFKTPLGVIMPEQVSDARGVLDKIAPYVVDNKYSSVVFGRLLEQYLRLVPHNVGRKRITPELIFPNAQSLQNENNLLDGLTVSFDDIQAGATTDKKVKKVVQPKLFDVTLDVVRDRKLVSRITKYFNDTKLNMHVTAGYKVKKVYEIQIGTMHSAFKKSGSPIGNIMELWHGTKCSNLLSILKKGLIIPGSSSGHVTGRMFGNGVYFSDQSTKALNYATNFWGSGGSTRRIFMFLADVAMGKSYTPSGWSSNLPKAGYDSTFAKARKSGVSNNEMIVYNLYQTNLKYLIEFE